MKISLSLYLSLGLLFSTPLAARVSEPTVERDTQGQLSLRWQDANPVDVYRIDAPGAATAPRLVARGVANGQLALAGPERLRGWFLLKDRRDGSQATVAERLLPLEQGSNFRDLGGYAGWGGRHVRWGMLYRSGATPLLTSGDLAQIQALGLQQMVDLRSSEERVLAPTRITGVPYGAVGYSFLDMMKGGAKAGTMNVQALYRGFPLFLKPQLKLVFDHMLRGETPIAYNCSAGQDRTGFATAMILSALGVPRTTIVADYLLSTQYRHPEFETPPIDLAQHPGDPVAQMFAQAGGKPRKPGPLMGADGQPYLTFAFEEIDRTWGSTDRYLKSELGIGPVELAILRQRYLQ